MQMKLLSRFGWSFIMAAMCAGAFARADVATNVWLSPAGGTWWYDVDENGVLTNWAGAVTRTNFPGNAIAKFRLADGAVVGLNAYQESDTGRWHTSDMTGFDVAPAEGETAEDPSWRFWISRSGSLLGGAAAPGISPFNVVGGTLAVDGEVANGNGFSAAPYHVVRKTGDGALCLKTFVFANDIRTVLDVSEGEVRPTSDAALAYADVRVTGDGRLELDPSAPAAHLGSLTVENGTTVDLNGQELLLGGSGATALSSAVVGTGRVTAVVSDLVVTNPASGVEYGAAAGRLRLDTSDGLALPFVRYGFETSLTADDSGQGRDLVQFGSSEAVTRVWDETRQSHVARFSGAAGGLSVSVPGSGLLSGDSDYTVSLWAKVAQIPAASSCPTLFTLGDGTGTTGGCVQGRFTDASCTGLLFGHWCQVGDFQDLPAPDAPAEWHHYVFQRLGGRCTIWVDGEAFVERNVALRLNLSDSSIFTLGAFPPSRYQTFPRFFNGDIDDVRVYPYAVGPLGVRRLAAGEEPFAQAGGMASSSDAPALPSDARLRTALNGEVWLGGGAVVSNVSGRAQRGGIVLPRGGDLSMTGPGRYDAGVSGADAFVKTGSGALTLGGNLSYTGPTRVEEGVLALASAATEPSVFALYGFDDSLAADAGPDALEMQNASGVERVWNEERRSYVARFSGASSQRLCREGACVALTGDSDYTISVWAKPDADCPAAGTFVSIGQEGNFQEIVFRYDDVSSGTLVISHWGGDYDYIGIPASENPQGAWHHYAVTRRGGVFSVYCDGRQVWTADAPAKVVRGAAGLSLPAVKKVFIGAQFNNWTRMFKGELDDVRIYSEALDAESVARLHRGLEPRAVPRGVEPAAASRAPEPVSRWSFEDAADIGRDTMGRHPLAKTGNGSFALVDSPLGGKAVRFPNTTPSNTGNESDFAYLHTDDGAIFPEGTNKAFSVSMWIQTSAGDQKSDGQHPYFLYFGSPSQIGYMFGFWYDNHSAWSTRDVMVSGRNDSGGNVLAMDVCGGLSVRGLHDADAALRWHHYVKVYEPNVGFRNYVDGQYQSEMSAKGRISFLDLAGMNLYLGARPDKTGVIFRGAIDEVRYYDRALTGSDVRAILREDLARGLAALPEGTAVEVAAGATLEVNGTDETVSALTGGGEVAVESGRVSVTGASAFDGTLRGDGTVRLPAGAALTLAQSPAEFTGVFEMAGGRLELPDGAALPALFRVCAVDGAAAAYPGDVEIPDGASAVLSADGRGPLVTAAGGVAVAGGGTVVLPDARASGTWTIARGAAVEATEEALAAWRVADLPASSRAVFQVLANGDFVCRIFTPATCVIIR